MCLVEGFAGESESAEQQATKVMEGLRWFRAASGHGHAQARYELGVCLYVGSVIEDDEPAACELFR